MNRDAIKSALQSGPDCLPLEVLASRMDLPAESKERRAAETHLGECAHCRTELALLREFESGAVRPEEQEAVEWITERLARGSAHPFVRPAGPRQTPWWRRRWTAPAFAVALAAAATLIVAINVEWRQPAIPGEGPDVVRSTPLRAISPVGDLSAPPQEFRWTAVSGASRYRLTVTEADRTLVFQDRFTTTSVPVPGEVRKALQPARTLFWSVAAEDASGSDIGSTGAQLIRLQISESK